MLKRNKYASDPIVVPYRVQRRARRAVQSGLMTWVEEICRQLPRQLEMSSEPGGEAILKEAELGAQSLLAMVVEYRKTRFPDA